MERLWILFAHPIFPSQLTFNKKGFRFKSLFNDFALSFETNKTENNIRILRNETLNKWNGTIPFDNHFVLVLK